MLEASDLVEVAATREINAPPEKVWSTITDLAGAGEWLSTLTQVEILEGEQFGVGTRWRETRRMFGREATATMTITAVDAERSYTAEASEGGTRYDSSLTVDPTHAGCTLTMSIDSTGQNLATKLLGATIGRLMVGQMRKGIEKDLADIAAHAEQP